MDAVVLLAILALGIIKTIEGRRGMPDFISQTAIGALVGSVLSAWWRKALRWPVNVAAGLIIGWWGGDWLIAAAGLPETIEWSRAVGAGLGSIGFSLMEAAMRTPWGDLAGKAIQKAAEMRGVGK